jgi:hypothetical protein
VQSLPKQDHNGDTSAENSVVLVLWVMSKMMDSTTLGNEKREPHLCCSEFSRLARSFSGVRYIESGPVTKEPGSEVYRPAAVGALLKKHSLTEKDEDAEMKIA